MSIDRIIEISGINTILDFSNFNISVFYVTIWLNISTKAKSVQLRVLVLKKFRLCLSNSARLVPTSYFKMMR